jgi:hypothetical protein
MPLRVDGILSTPHMARNYLPRSIDLGSDTFTHFLQTGRIKKKFDDIQLLSASFSVSHLSDEAESLALPRSYAIRPKVSIQST